MTLIMFFSFLSVSEQSLVILVLLKYYQNVKGIIFNHSFFLIRQFMSIILTCIWWCIIAVSINLKDGLLIVETMWVRFIILFSVNNF